MKRIASTFLLLLFMAGCGSKRITPSKPLNIEMPGITSATPDITSAVKPTSVLSVDTPVPKPPSEVEALLYISYLHMIDVDHGWALVSGKGLPRFYILHTVDGGITWKDVTPPQLISLRNHSYYFSGSMAVLDDNTAWAIANGGYPLDSKWLYGTVWHTDNGGLSWKPGNPIYIFQAGPQMIVNGFDTKLDFADTQDGWLRATIQGVMGHSFNAWFRTTDGGLTWKRFLSPDICSDYVRCDYLFVGGMHGFRTVPAMDGVWSTVGEIQTSQAWQIEKTVDGGATWSRIDLLPPTDLVASLFSGQDYQPSKIADFKINIKQRVRQFGARAIGLRMDFAVYSAEVTAHPLFERGFYYISEDGGQTWQPFLFSGDLFLLTDVTGWRFFSQGDGYRLQKTTNGGTTWSPVGKEISEAGSIQFVDDHTGWMILQKPDLSMRLMRTIDGGQSWINITVNMWGSLLSNTSISFPSGTITPIPAEPWIARIEANSPLVLNTIHMSDLNYGWGTSLNGYIFHTDDGGHTWRDVTPQYGTIDSQRDFFALDALHAWTIILPLPGCLTEMPSDYCPDYYRTRGPVWYTEDGGQSWSPGGLFPDPERTFETRLIKIRFANEVLGWAQWLSRDPNANQALYHLYKTMDGGESWMPVINEPYQAEFLFLSELSGFKYQESPGWAKTLDEFMNGSALGVLQKTLDGGKTWSPVILPNFVFNIADVGMQKADISSIFADCSYPEMYSSGTQGIVIKIPCFIPDMVDFWETYYSSDGGQSWSNWTSHEYVLTFYAQPRWEQWMSGADEFFLDNGAGWRLFKSSPDSPAWIQQTVDGGKAWKTIKTVAWQAAKFDFVNEQDGWAIVTNSDNVALVHTSDSGKSWVEVKPVVAEQ